MKSVKRLTIAVAALAMAAPVAAQEATRSYQGLSLLGDPMYTDDVNPTNVTDTKTLLWAVADAKAAAEREPTIDNIAWYGRMLGYQTLAREAVAVFTEGLKRYPNSAKLLRHRAHRYFNLREFDLSIADGLKAAALYEGQPLERERLGPSQFPGTPDIVQFYLYYHLGGAYFAKRDYRNAEKWFDRAYQLILLTGNPQDIAAPLYWRYLALMKLDRTIEADELLARYKFKAEDLAPTGEGPFYFNAIQLFRGNRFTEDYYTEKDSGRPFGGADGAKASSSYTLAMYWLMRGEREKAKPWLARAMDIKTWAYFPRIQAEVEWKNLYGDEKPVVSAP